MLDNPDVIEKVSVGVNDNSEDLREKYGYHVADYINLKLDIQM